MSNTEKTREILERAFAEWRKLQTLKKGKTSIGEFGKYLGYSQQAVSFWLNKTYPISNEAKLKLAPKFAELLGIEIYKELNLPEPEESLEYIKENWNEFTEEEKEILQKQAEKFVRKRRNER